MAWEDNSIRKGNNMVIALVIILLVLVILALYTGATYNSLVRCRNKAEEALSGLDAHLKQRYDLIPNLVETVKGYASHEEETLSRVISARNMAMNSPAAQKGKAEDILSGTLKSLFALSESYPDLKANVNFMQLQEKLSGLEDDILKARKYYNALAREMNDRVQMFPSSLIASLFHFLPLAYIETSNEEKAVPEVRF